jgi:hypothetical protein
MEENKLDEFAKEISEDPEPQKCFEEICLYEEYNLADRILLAEKVRKLIFQRELK